MFKQASEVIIGMPYPKSAGSQYGYRVFDGTKWHDWDKYEGRN